MKTFLIRSLVVLFLAGASSLRAERFDAATWAGVKTYEVQELPKPDQLPVGQLVTLKFNYRHDKIRHLKPNWYQGSLWSNAPAGKKKFSFVQVQVPQSALAAFKALPSNFDSVESHVAYGKVVRDTEAKGFRFVVLFGTKMEKDGAGNVTISW